MFVCFFLKNSLCSNTIIWDLAVLTNCLYCWCMSTINWLASMVCFSPSLFSNFYLNYLKPIWVFSHFIRYLQSLLEPHLKFCTFFSFSFFFLFFLFFLFFFFVFLGVIVCARTIWRDLYNGEARCYATWTCKLYFNLLAILNKPISNLVAEKA